jgi:hypothetical protein
LGCRIPLPRVGAAAFSGWKVGPPPAEAGRSGRRLPRLGAGAAASSGWEVRPLPPEDGSSSRQWGATTWEKGGDAVRQPEVGRERAAAGRR